MVNSLVNTLKKSLLALLSKQNSHAQLNEIISFCHAIAVSYLKNTVIDGTKNQEFLGINRRDAAFDCIADLFQQGEHGNFIQLEAYFCSFTVENFSNQEVLLHLRRLVSSRVNQGMYRIYQEADPSLGKIIRNIKLSIQLLKNYEVIELFGEIHLTPIQCNVARNLPIIDLATLENELSALCNGSENIPQLLAKLSLYLREQTDFRRSAPLIAVALAFRALYAQDLKSNEIEQPKIEETLSVEESTIIVRQACEEIKRTTEEKYLTVKKIKKCVFQDYFCAIEKNLEFTILGTNGEDTSLFGALKNRLPNLTPDQYQKKHRNTVEYLARLCKDEAIKRLKKNYEYKDEL